MPKNTTKWVRKNKPKNTEQFNQQIHGKWKAKSNDKQNRKRNI